MDVRRRSRSRLCPVALLLAPEQAAVAICRMLVRVLLVCWDVHDDCDHILGHVLV